jgi:hypothetical protein
MAGLVPAIHVLKHFDMAGASTTLTLAARLEGSNDHRSKSELFRPF